VFHAFAFVLCNKDLLTYLLNYLISLSYVCREMLPYMYSQGITGAIVGVIGVIILQVFYTDSPVKSAEYRTRSF